MTLGEVRKLPASEVMRWWAAYQIEPFGEKREDFRNALLCHVIVASQQGSDKAPAPSDFMHDFWATPEDHEDSEEDSFLTERWREVMKQRRGGTNAG